MSIKEEPERGDHWDVHWRLILEWPKCVNNITPIKTPLKVTSDAVVYAMHERLRFLFPNDKSYQLLAAILRRDENE